MNQLYDVVYQVRNGKGKVVTAVVLRDRQTRERAGEWADRIGSALMLKPGLENSWLTIMPDDVEEYVFLTESNDMS